MPISQVQKFLANNMTMRGTGQDLRSSQLSEMRKICSLLAITTFYGKHNYILNEENLEIAKNYVRKYRTDLSQILEQRDYRTDTKDSVFNKLLSIWGFAGVKVIHTKLIGTGKSAFTKSDSTVDKFRKFRKECPEFVAFISTQNTDTVANRKKNVKRMQEKIASIEETQKDVLQKYDSRECRKLVQ